MGDVYLQVALVIVAVLHEDAIAQITHAPMLRTSRNRLREASKIVVIHLLQKIAQ